MSKQKIILVLCPSAVGKSYLLNALEQDYSFLKIEIDTDRQNKSFKANGFPSERDQDYHKVDFAKIECIVRKKLNKHAGAVISFPTSYVLSLEELAKASKHGVPPVILWGTKEHCIQACKERRRQKNIPFNLKDYEKKNNPIFEKYAYPKYSAYRVEAFQSDGSRFPCEQWLTQIIE